MKIIFLIPALSTGGAERVVSVLCNHWVEKKQNLNISILTFDSPEKDFYKLNNKVNRYYIGYSGQKNKTILRKISDNLFRLFYIRKNLKLLKPDVIITFMPEMNILALIANLFTKIPIIISERTYPPYFKHNFFFNIARKVIYKLSNSFVAQTHDAAIWAESFLQKKKIKIIANPVLVGKPLKLKKSFQQKQKIILAVGRLCKEKGFDILINAYYSIYKKHSDWKLLIVGEGEERRNLEKQIKKLKLGKKVILTGQTNNPKQYYQFSDIFVLSSRVEGFPNALLEAMSYGLPVISFACKAGPSDLIRNGKNGLLIANEDIDALAEAMKTLVDNSALRKKLSSEATKVRDKYNIDVISKKWIDLLDEVASSSKINKRKSSDDF